MTRLPADIENVEDNDGAAPGIRRLAIVGLGLMGGSLGLAMGERRPDIERVGSARREETRREALRRGAVDRAVADPAEAVRGADAVVFCLPVLAIPPAARACIASFADDCAVTDVGSTKAWLMDELGPALAGPGRAFVGAHPIAGSDAGGLEAARPDLYRGALVIVTPAGGAAGGGGAAVETAVARIEALWRAVGARVAVMAPAEHDRRLARTSHLPHLAAAALTAAVCREPGVERFCGAGFRDTTRIAAGGADVWHDIFLTNREAVLDELAAYSTELDRARRALEEQDFEELKRFLAEAALHRRRFREKP